ncbi:MAG TPA: CHAT domain-containing protein, partial [Nocardioides sp.]|uniref:CHAT domain-containing protein n=1 Tax=Nocardioides sp. TaxID=35761 RepID=UPI002B5343F3
MTATGWPVLASLVREDLAAVPGPVLAAAEAAWARGPQDGQAQFLACLAALIAGEPRRALAHLDGSVQPPRVTAALTAWARQLDGNWYPGDVGGETTMELADAFVEPAPGQPTEELLEQVVRYGPLSLVTPRTLLETSLRNGAPAGAQQAVAVGGGNLDTLGAYAAAHGRGDLAIWTLLAGADLTRRAGLLPQSQQLLATARAQFAAVGDAPRLALTHLVEGDWYAAPGASPESLGWDLAPQPGPSPFGPADLPRAAAAYDVAAAVLGPVDVPRLRGALALRRAFLARGASDPQPRRRHLDEAAAAYAVAGDSAAAQLVAVHRLVADIDDGVLGAHALDLGSGWHRPGHGPVAGVLAWADSVGSRSWCVGLGRLLQRCGEEWDARGSAPRARVAYLAAVQLIAVEPRIPSRTFLTAVAHADTRNNLATNALLRLERGFGPLLADATGGGEFDFPQRLEAALVMVSALRDRSRGAAAPLAAARMTLLRDQLAEAVAQLRATLPPVAGPLPTTMAELQQVLTAAQGDGSWEAQAGRVPDAMTLMQHMQLQSADGTVAMADVLASLIRAEAAQRSGRPGDADRWFDQAVAAAGRPEAEPYLLPLALVSAYRLEEARTALRERPQLPDSLQLPLWLRAEGDAEAAATLDRMTAAGFVPADWRDRLTVAELALRRGDRAAARTALLEAVADFEDSVRLLLRDPERLDACDQPDVAALYTLLARTYLPLAGEPAPEEADESLAAAELVRALTEDVEDSAGSAETRRVWQRAAAEYAAVANRVLAGLPTATPEQRERSFAALDHADADLATAEHARDAEQPGVLLRRTARRVQPGPADIRRALPEGAVLLEYLAVGDDLLVWGMTRDTVRPVRQTVRLRTLAELVRRFHTSCAEGRGSGADLARLLVEPVADLVRAHPRVLVSPFGPLNLVPFHALPLDGAPLAATHVVSYLPRAGRLVADAPDLDRPTPAALPLVVGDPAFDPGAHPSLVPLPGSRLEAGAVAQALGVPPQDVLVGASASESEVARRLDRCDLLHVSSHGHLDELSPFASALVLAGTDELTVADIAGLRFATDLAVLTGCDTGRGNATLGGDVVGLSRALLRSGVGRAVVSLWPVDDWVAPVVMQRFYTGLAQRQPPAYALAEAQRAVRELSAEG